jgi:signal recognition particle subunit SRP54
MAQRILGQGDVATLLETAQRVLDQEEMARQQEKMLAGKFTLDDFLKSMEQISKMGSMRSIMKLIPGMGQVSEALDKAGDMDPDKDVKRLRAMIQSMTLDERQNPDKIDRARRTRIARGSGTDPSEVHDLQKQFKQMSGMMQKMAGMGTVDKFRAVRELQAEMMNPAGPGIQREKQRSKRGPEDRDKFRDQKKAARKAAKASKKKNRRR